MACQRCDGKTASELFGDLVGLELEAPDDFVHCPTCGRDLRLPVARVSGDSPRQLCRDLLATHRHYTAELCQHDVSEVAEIVDLERGYDERFHALFGPVTVSPREVTE